MQAEKRQDRDDNHDQSDEIDNTVHCFPLFAEPTLMGCNGHLTNRFRSFYNCSRSGYYARNRSDHFRRRGA